MHSFFIISQLVGKFTEYKVPLKTLAPGTHSFEYRLGKQFFLNMESADIHDADLTVSLQVTLKNDVYMMHFDIKGTITLLCDRCLDELILPVDTVYDINVKYGDDYNDENDDLLVLPFSDNYLNVAYMIYDTVALTIPMKHVHPLGKCNRQMSAVLKKHRAVDAEDADLTERLIDEMDSMDAASDAADAPADPRWEGLKNFNPDSE